MNSVVWLVSGILLLFAVVFGTIGICIGKNNRKKENVCTVETIATVIDIKRITSAGENSVGSLYHPVFEYYAGAVSLTDTCVWGTNPSKYKVGEKVVLYYNSEKPTEYLMKNDKTSKILSVVFTCVGAFFLLVSIVIPLVANQI